MMIERGSNLHNRALNLTGVVFDSTDSNAIVVMTTEGKKTWSLGECDVIEQLG